ncbi:MAG: Ig-like domain-containing protein, partial [Gemmatimonadales bacterium]|nr:Ig-like domain-containing protein [Gemmatimonadales bacterium]
MLPRRDLLGLLASALLLAACGEGGVEGPVGPRDSVPPPPAPRLLASAPVPRTLLGQAGSETVAYVSAPTGLLVRGALAAVVNQRTGERLLTPLAAGGFDPVALVATDGDVLEVTLTDSAGGVTTTPLTVKRGAKPRVVRTVPEPRATDVPLNSVIRVVFTTPVRASDAAGAIRLFSGGEEVAGTVRVDGEAAVIVDFEPATPLVANTDYELRVDASLRDVLGT